MPKPIPKIVGRDTPAFGKAACASAGVAVAWATVVGVAVAPGGVVGVVVGVGDAVPVGLAVGVAVELPVGVAVGVAVAVVVAVGVGVCPNVKARAWQAMGTPCALGLEVGAVGATDSFLN